MAASWHVHLIFALHFSLLTIEYNFVSVLNIFQLNGWYIHQFKWMALNLRYAKDIRALQKPYSIETISFSHAIRCSVMKRVLRCVTFLRVLALIEKHHQFPWKWKWGQHIGDCSLLQWKMELCILCTKNWNCAVKIYRAVELKCVQMYN